MEKRYSIIDKVLAAFISGNKLVSEHSDNLDTDHEMIAKMLVRMNLKDKISISKDRDKGLLWFKKR